MNIFKRIRKYLLLCAVSANLTSWVVVIFKVDIVLGAMILISGFFILGSVIGMFYRVYKKTRNLDTVIEDFKSKNPVMDITKGILE